MTYEQANELLGERLEKRIAPNTWLKRDAREFHIVFHPITFDVIFHPITICVIHPDCIVLNSGGYRTATIKERLNRYSPVPITQVKGIWFLGQNLFEDGATVRLEQ